MPNRQSNPRNAVLAGLAVGCVVFVCLAAARLPALYALALAVTGGAAVVAAISKWPRWSPGDMPPPRAEPAPVTVATQPPHVPFQTQPVTDIRLPTAIADYHFRFNASIVWRPCGGAAYGAGGIAVHEVISRAGKVTAQRDPSEATLATFELSAVLGVLQPDPARQVEAKAESVQLLLPPEDQRRLDEIATLRKDEGLWAYQRRHQVNKRHYLRTDVLKDAGSAIVWWLAQHEDNLDQVADKIEVLTRLANVANANETNEDQENNAVQATYGEPDDTPTPAEHFDTFLDSLNPPPEDDVRLTLTTQVARLVGGHDQKAADEMRRRTERGADGHPRHPETPEDTPPDRSGYEARS